MTNKYLARDDAPFDETVWDVLDSAMKKTAKNHLVGRHLLDVEGPYGLGLKSIPLEDKQVQNGLVTSQVLPVLYLYKNFTLGTRDIANFEREGVALETYALTEAVQTCASMEDDLVFNGTKQLSGLMTVKGSDQLALSEWDEEGTAAESIIEAITRLDDAGYHGPYVLALTPERYNLLYRLYPHGKQSELEHIQTMVTGGVFKSPNLDNGGLLMASTVQSASLYLGQDMNLGYIGPAGDRQEFVVSESLTVRIQRPDAICILTDK